MHIRVIFRNIVRLLAVIAPDRLRFAALNQTIILKISLVEPSSEVLLSWSAKALQNARSSWSSSGKDFRETLYRFKRRLPGLNSLLPAGVSAATIGRTAPASSRLHFVLSEE